MRAIGTTVEIYRGVATWVAKTLGRHVTFKDVGRRAAMSRLARDGTLSLEEKAKYFGVHPRTMEVYHRMHNDTPLTAATVLSHVVKRIQLKKKG